MMIFLIVFPNVVLVGCPENTVPKIPPYNNNFIIFLLDLLENILVYKSVAFFIMTYFLIPQNPSLSHNTGNISFRMYTSIDAIIIAD